MSSETIAGVVPILPVQDLARAIDFCERLGFTAKRYRDGDFYAFIQRDGSHLHLSRRPDLVQENNPVHVYFYLREGTVATLEAHCRAAGMTIVEPLAPREWKMNEFGLRDPDGNRLIFGESLAEDHQ
ncbi:MAG TPA: VOC family protein [Bryocella sp.]|nr:VOC family protein [Bryocella sp.]